MSLVAALKIAVVLLQPLRSVGWWAFVLALVAVAATLAALDAARSGLVAALKEEGSWLAADMQLVANRPINEARRAEAEMRFGAATSASITLSSMLRNPEGKIQLAMIRGVEASYPLKGSFQGKSPYPFKKEHAPAPGEIWIEERLATLLGVAPGDRLWLGVLELSVGAVFDRAPELGNDPLALLPQAYVALATLSEAGVLRPESRAQWRFYFVADTPQSRAELEAWLSAQLAAGEQLLSSDTAQPFLQTLIEEIYRFVRLLTVGTLVLAWVGMHWAGRFLTERLVGVVALLRALGAGRGELAVMLSVMLFALVLVALFLGAGLGVALGGYALKSVAELGGAEPTIFPWRGLSEALLLALSAIVPLLMLLLTGVSSQQVLYQQTAFSTRKQMHALLISLALALIVFGISAHGQSSWIALAVFGALFVLSAAGAYLVMRLGAALTERLHPLIFLAFLERARHFFIASTQAASFTLGFGALGFLAMLARDVLPSWQASLPLDGPNHYLIQLSQDDKEPLQNLLRQKASEINVQFWPVVRARWVMLDDKALQPEAFASMRAQRLVQREFNLTYADELPQHNTLVAGSWWASDKKAALLPPISVEAGLAELFGIKLGSKLTFSIEGELHTFVVHSIRALKWESLAPNFFFVAPSWALQPYVTSWFAAFRWPLQSSAAAVQLELAQRFPHASVVDLTQLQARFIEIAEAAVRFLYMLFALMMFLGALIFFLGFLLLLAERLRTGRLLRVLGAGQRAIALWLIAPEAFLALKGAALAWGSALLGGAMLRDHLVLHFPLPWWLSGYLLGAVGVVIGAGWLMVRAAMRRQALG